jgi:glycosyltransferase involved in cell wall biosynthesis
MKISIITVCLNAEATITTCINSVLEQTYSNIEYIIIDGGSTDKTIDIITTYSNQISFFCSEPDKGLYEALNKGILKSSGEIIAFLHADDVYANPEVIEDYINAFNTYNTDGVYANICYTDQNNLKRITRVWKSGKYKPNAFTKGWMPPHPSLILRKSCYLQFGMFRTDMSISADYELMLRFIHVNNITLYYLNQNVILMRQGGKSNTGIKARINAHRQDYLAWAYNNISPKWYTLILKPIKKIRQFF